jgi:hypothetical protein
LHFKPKHWIKTLALEAETAISYAEAHEQNYLRYAVSRALTQLVNKNIHNNRIAKQEWNTMKEIKQKITNNKLIITQADKGKSVVIIHEHEYNNIVHDFINTNQFTELTHDPVKQHQTNIKQIIKQCPELIPKNQQWRYHNMNPQTPNLHALIKLHKNPISIRPIINRCNSPAYKLATHLTHILKQYIHLPSPFNIKNTPHLINDLQNININKDIRLCSFDISNMYTNIPTNDMINIVRAALKHHNIRQKISDEIINITNTILSHNYFQFSNTCYRQEEGLAMGAPSSAILAEIYLQYIESINIYDILQKHNVIGYFRYVDDILLVYNEEITNINLTLQEFNNIHPKLTFTIEKEENNKINFLDITIQRTENKLTFGIHRKITATDT